MEATFNVGSYAIGRGDHGALRSVCLAEENLLRQRRRDYMHLTSAGRSAGCKTGWNPSGEGRYTLEETRFLEPDRRRRAGKYLGAKFQGQAFSPGRGDAMVPVLKELIRRAGEQGCKEAVIGMAHRGRLNVLINVLGKRAQDLFDEFAGKHGDLRAQGREVPHGLLLRLLRHPGRQRPPGARLQPVSPRIVNPVVIGSVRARMDRRGDKDGSSVLPITIHGDSAIAGQGVVAGTFSMSQTRAYGVGGTVRIVISNQVGFTTSYIRDLRSTECAPDIAKAVQAPCAARQRG